jgi:hypothetical protein
MTSTTTTGRKRGKRSFLLRRFALFPFAPSSSWPSSWPAGISQGASRFDSLHSPFGLPAAVYLRLRCDSQDILPEIELGLVGMVAFGLGTKEPVLKARDDLVFPEKLLLYEFERYTSQREFLSRPGKFIREFLNPSKQFLKVFRVFFRHRGITLTSE